MNTAGVMCVMQCQRPRSPDSNFAFSFLTHLHSLTAGPILIPIHLTNQTGVRSSIASPSTTCERAMLEYTVWSFCYVHMCIAWAAGNLQLIKDVSLTVLLYFYLLLVALTSLAAVTRVLFELIIHIKWPLLMIGM